MSLRRLFCLLPLSLLFVGPLATAQTTLSGAVAGTATDPQHATVPNAQITLQSAATAERFTAPTGPKGDFRIVQLPPGAYSLTSAAQGFANFHLLRVIVEVGRFTEVNINFAVATTSQTVEVRDEAPAVNTGQPDFAANINIADIDNLPTDGRRWSNFALLTPTATLDGDFGLISFRGISGLLNSSTVDGADNNQSFFSEERGRSRISYVISQAAVQEFQVNTSNFSAEYGRAAGSVVNAITRSGTDQFHGSAFYFMRDNALGATNPFTVIPVPGTDGATEPIKPLDRRQQFGGTFGGPIVKNKLYFFTNFDAQRRDFPAVAAANKPLSLFAPACVTQFHYGQISGLYPADKPLVKACYSDDSSRDEIYALTRPFGISDLAAITAFQNGITYLQNLLGPVPRTGDHQIGFAKLDYHLDSRNTVSLLYDRLRWNSPGGSETDPVVNIGSNSFGLDGVKVDTLVARLTSTLGHSFSNELRYSWSRDFEFQLPQTNVPGQPAGPGGLAPSVALMADSSGFTFGTPATQPRLALPDEFRNQIAETISWVHHRHIFKFGFDANRVVDQMNNLYAVAGAYRYDYRANFMADLYQWQNNLATPTGGNQGYSSYTQGFGTPAFAFHTFDGALFAQDDFRPLRRLTVSLGLRYDFELLPSPQVPNSQLPATRSFPSDMNNFGPRFGFAWAATSDGKTALRGGYGLYYARISNSTISAAITNTGTQLAQSSYSYNACWANAKNCLTGPIFPNINAAPPTGQAGNVTVFSPNMQVPQIHQADLILERQVAHNTIISASYLLSLGRELPNFVDINLDPASLTTVPYTFYPDYYDGTPGPYNKKILKVPVYTARLNPNFESITQIRSNINSTYSALVLQFNHTSSKGLGFKINYTWAHAIDNGQSSTTFSTYNNTLSPIPFTYQFDGVSHFVKRPDYGTSNYDIRHRIVASLHWSPRPFAHSHGVLHDTLDHWSLAPIVLFSTGKPYSDNVSGDAPLAAITNNVTCAACYGFLGSGGATRLPFLGRNSFRLANFYNTDLRLSRRIYLGEAGSDLEFMAEAFNLFNHSNITHRTSTMYTAYDSPKNGPELEYDSNFNTPTAAANTIYRERQIQLGLRLHF